MRFKHHPLLDLVENKWYRDYTMSSGAKLGSIRGGSGVQLAKAEGRVPVGLAFSSLGQNSLVFHGLIWTEMPITRSRPLLTDHREISVCQSVCVRPGTSSSTHTAVAHPSHGSITLLNKHMGAPLARSTIDHGWCWRCISSVRIRIYQSQQLWSLCAGCWEGF